MRGGMAAVHRSQEMRRATSVERHSAFSSRCGERYLLVAARECTVSDADADDDELGGIDPAMRPDRKILSTVLLINLGQSAAGDRARVLGSIDSAHWRRSG